MNTESVTCNHCGAPLTIPEAANFVKCNHCDSRLAIRRTESVTFTEQLEQIESNQSEMLSRLRSLEQQNEVASIDRSWERQKQHFMITDKHGRQHTPSMVGAIVMFVVCGFGIVFSIVGAVSRTPVSFFGFAVAAIGFIGGIYTMHKTQEYRAAYRSYRRRRKAVYQAGPGASTSRFEDLSNLPTPQEYLEQLEETDSNGIHFSD